MSDRGRPAPVSDAPPSAASDPRTPPPPAPHLGTPPPKNPPGRSALTGVVIEPMRRRHLRAVLDIERRVYPKGWSAEVFASELTEERTRRYVVALAPRADRDGWRAVAPAREVVGYGGLLLQIDDAHITTVAVHPAHHRRKIASRVLLALLDAALVMGAQAVTLEVRAANAGAQRLYSRFGFAPVGVRPRYYPDTGEDAVVMWLHDLRGDAVAARLDAERRRLVEAGGSSGLPDELVPHVTGRIGLAGERS